MFQGQPKKAKYKVGDTVHLVNPTNHQSSATGGTYVSRKRSPTPNTHLGMDNDTTWNISKSSAYKVTAINAAGTDKQTHQYELTPIEPLKVTAAEANIIPAQFLPGDIVEPTASAAGSEDYYRVKSVTVKEDPALLTMMIGYGADPSRPVRDDGEYEMLENPFAGGFHATRRREAAGVNNGGTRRTSLGKADPEERVKVVLNLVDGVGIRAGMDAAKVRKVPKDQEWKFVKLEKFMGQR